MLTISGAAVVLVFLMAFGADAYRGWEPRFDACHEDASDGDASCRWAAYCPGRLLSGCDFEVVVVVTAATVPARSVGGAGPGNVQCEGSANCHANGTLHLDAGRRQLGSCTGWSEAPEFQLTCFAR